MNLFAFVEAGTIATPRLVTAVQDSPQRLDIFLFATKRGVGLIQEQGGVLFVDFPVQRRYGRVVGLPWILYQ